MSEDTTNTSSATGATEEAEKLVDVQLPAALVRLLSADTCVVIATDVEKGLPIGWAGLRNGTLGLSDVVGQQTLLLAVAKMSEMATAKTTADYLARLQAEANKRKSGLVLP